MIELERWTETTTLPDDVAKLLQAADARIERFVRGRLDQPLPAFVPSDFASVYAALWEIEDRRLAAGRSFCEWGSGFGVVACLASRLGYSACGIEIEPDLVDEARRLADDFDLPVEFACGSFLPHGGEALVETNDDFNWLDLGGQNGYDELELDADDFDVIFAYPWPGEEQVIIDLFDRYAATGALLVTYHGLEGVRVQRRT